MKQPLDMVLVPESFFIMGSDLDENDAVKVMETPRRKVWLPTYSIQRNPVSVAQWSEYLDSSGYSWPFRAALNEIEFEESMPIVLVSWYDASNFAEWLRSISGQEYSLPSEAQWEKACRGTEGQQYPWGNVLGPDWIDELADANRSAEEIADQPSLESEPGTGFKKTQFPVGWRPDRASPYGCLDMWYNVSEWCLDWLDYPRGTQKKENKVFKGGGLASSGWPRCAHRGFQVPEFRHPGLGFRVVLNAEN